MKLNMIDYIRMLPADIAVNVERAVKADRLHRPYGANYTGFKDDDIRQLLCGIVFSEFIWHLAESRLGLPEGYFTELVHKLNDNSIQLNKQDTNELI